MSKKTNNSAATEHETVEGEVLPANRVIQVQVVDAAVAKPTTTAEYDPFAMQNMRVRQTFGAAPAERHFTTIAVRKPHKNSFFRVNPGEEYCREAYLFTEKDDRGMDKETYLVDPRFAETLEDEDLDQYFNAKRLVLCIERHSEKPFVWDIGLPNLAGKDYKWWSTAREIAEIAKEQWVKLLTSEDGYDWKETKKVYPDPKWPKLDFSEILRIAFKGKIIDSWDHAIMQKLEGRD